MTNYEYDFGSGTKDIVTFKDARHITAMRNGKVIVDSKAAILLLERGLNPTWYFPKADVNMAALNAVDLTTHCPRKGDAAYYAFNDDADAIPLIWYYPKTLAQAKQAESNLAFYFSEMDQWRVDGVEVKTQAQITDD